MKDKIIGRTSRLHVIEEAERISNHMSALDKQTSGYNILVPSSSRTFDWLLYKALSMSNIMNDSILYKQIEISIRGKYATRTIKVAETSGVQILQT